MRKGTLTTRLARFAATATVAAAAMFGLTPTALAGSYPSPSVDGTQCTPYTGSSVMAANYSILGANRYSGWGENQIVYVRATLYSYTTGSTLGTTPWIYGRAYDFRSPLAWFRDSDDAYLGDGTFRLTFSMIPRGTYRVAVQFAWDASAWGAPAGSSGWVWAPDFCTFNY